MFLDFVKWAVIVSLRIATQQTHVQKAFGVRKNTWSFLSVIYTSIYINTSQISFLDPFLFEKINEVIS